MTEGTADGSYMPPDASVIVRWREHAREWARRHLPGMAESRRIDPDYNPNDDHVRELLRTVNQLLARPLGHNYGVNGNGNGNWKAIAIVLGALVTLDLIVLGWFSSTVIETRQDVLVMKCQLDPKCPKVQVANGSP